MEWKKIPNISTKDVYIYCALQKLSLLQDTTFAENFVVWRITEKDSKFGLPERPE